MRETASVRETTSENEERGERATALGGEREGVGVRAERQREQRERVRDNANVERDRQRVRKGGC